MKTFLFLIPVLACVSGCLTATNVVLPADWPIEAKVEGLTRAEKPSFGVTRFSQITVCAPYDARQLTVLRADGTLAYDSYNRFAALPSQLAKGAMMEVFAASGRFRGLVGSISAATTDSVLETVLTRWVLDCRAEGEPKATAVVLLRLLDRNRAIVSQAKGEGVIAVSDGNFGAAFSQALSAATQAAVKAL